MNPGGLGSFFEFPLCGARLLLSLVKGIEQKGDGDKGQYHNENIEEEALSVNFSAERTFRCILPHSMPADFTLDKGRCHVAE